MILLGQSNDESGLVIAGNFQRWEGMEGTERLREAGKSGDLRSRLSIHAVTVIGLR